MIGHTLHDKVAAMLKEGISNEAQLVYFIVVLRKLMERAGARDRAIKFFLDWPLHASISRSASEILVEMNHALETGDTAEAIAVTIGLKLSMETFREQLIHQLMHFSLPTSLVGSMQSWLQFLLLYFRVIADCPVLSCTKTLSRLDRLAVRLTDDSPDDLPPGAAFAFRINWTFMKDQDTVFEWNNDVLYPKDYTPGVFYQLRTPR